MDNGLEIIVVLLERKKERVPLVAAERTGEGTLFHVAAFGRLGCGKEIARVENGVTGQEIHGAMVGGRAGLSGDFNACSARPGKSRGIRILIDFHFLNGGSGDARAVGFDTVDDERDAAGGDGVVAEESRKKSDVVEIEDRDAIEGVARDVVRIEIFGGSEEVCGMFSLAVTLTTSLTAEMASVIRRGESGLAPTVTSTRPSLNPVA